MPVMKGKIKLKAMVHNITWRCGGRHDFRRVMLCRLCYFSNFGSFELRRHSISGAVYVIAMGARNRSDSVFS